MALVPLIAGCTAVVLNHLVYPHAYPGLHLWLLWLAGLALPPALASIASSRAFVLSPMHRRGLFALALLVATISLAVWPPNRVLLELYRSPGSAITPFLARIHPASQTLEPAFPPDDHWFEDRSAAPAVPAGPPMVSRSDLIVILISIDAIRADVFDREELALHMPTLQRLRATGADFSMARSTGSQTVYTLSTIFSGRHFSQMFWSKRNPEQSTAQLWPWDDRLPRLGELLQAAGVKTMTFASAHWLTGHSGVVRGFDLEKKIRSEVKTAYGFPLAKDLMAPAIEEIAKHEGGPLFVFMHFMDPHAPYNQGGRGKTPMESYAKEIGTVDKELAALIEALESAGHWQNTVLMVRSDHGEAFGEHGTKEHATTLYEELLRIPLIVRTPGQEPRRIEEPVSTIDLGPTILDLFGVETPGFFMGQNLAPLLRGEQVFLTRPIIAEGRLKQALVERNGLKAIRDLRRTTLEVYDLSLDPEELRDISETERAKKVLGRLAAFFQAHSYSKDGYQVPFRK